MKSLTKDESGLIFLPILVGLSALAGYLGFNWLTDGADPIEMLKVWGVATLLFVFGLITLMGKVILFPRVLGVLIGLGCVGAAIYLVYLGRFPI